MIVYFTDKKLLEITKLASAQYKELSDEKKEVYITYCKSVYFREKEKCSKIDRHENVQVDTLSCVFA